MYLQQPDALNLAAAQLIELALAEDIGSGDLTSLAVIPEDLRFAGVMAAREDLVIAGLPFAVEVFRRVDPAIRFTAKVKDGDKVVAGTVLAELEGPAQGLLTGERTALNLLAHLSGIATMTRVYVEAIAGSGAVLLDTRKTIPGLRQLAKYAARMGGAQNHRMGLYDGILIKDNHIAVCGSVSEAVRRAKSAPGGAPLVEVECDTLEQVAEAIAAGPDMILFDNMAPELMGQAVAIVGGRAKTEASGGIRLETIAAVAATGVDYISVGRLTQSARAVDIGLDWSAR